MLSYAILLAIALAINLRDPKMLALSALVGAGVFAPVPDAHFYLVCALGETLIALVACRIGATASWFIVRVSTLLVIGHALGYFTNGYPPESPYHLFIKICEHAELIGCILTANYFTKRFRHAR